MRSRRQDKTAPAFLDEKTARKQAERQVLLDALSGRLETEAIEWTAGNDIAPELLASPRIQLWQWKDTDREPFAAMVADPEVMLHPARKNADDE